jgi:hypothetical protein
MGIADHHHMGGRRLGSDVVVCRVQQSRQFVGDEGVGFADRASTREVVERAVDYQIEIVPQASWTLGPIVVPGAAVRLDPPDRADRSYVQHASGAAGLGSSSCLIGIRGEASCAKMSNALASGLPSRPNGEVVMPYLNCPNCRLTVLMTRPDGVVEHCPRCLARQRRTVDLFVSAHVRGREPAAMHDRPWLTQSQQPGKAVEGPG